MRALETIDLIKDFGNYERLEDRTILFEHLKAKGLPSKKDELFRQSGIEKVYGAKTDICARERSYVRIPKGPCIVFSDGVLDADKTNLASHMSLQKVKPLEALHVKESLPLMAHTLTHTTWRLNIHDHAEDSITIIHRSLGGEHHSALDVVVEKGVHASIIERYEYDAGVVNHANEIVVKDEATLELTRVQLSSVQSYPIASYNVEVEEKARAHVVSFEKGASVGISRWNVELSGDESVADFNVLQLGEQSQHLSTLVNMHHNAPSSKSNQLIKQIIADHSQGTIDATVNVSSEGTGTVAHQLCRSLLLSEEAKARVHVKPQLEIYIDDLEASHGASVGQLDEGQLFYLMSRGFSEAEASELLKGAFIREVVEKIPTQHLDEVLMLVPEVEYDTDG